MVLQLSVHIVDFTGASPAFRAWHSMTGVHAKADMHIDASFEAEAFLLWWPGGLPFEWTPNAGTTPTYVTDICCR